MKWEKETAGDIVMGAAAKLAEDMVHGTVSSIKEISKYHSMYKNMAIALGKSAGNMRRHLLRKKWMSANDKKAIRLKITQIRMLARVCNRLQMWCTAYATGSINELKKMEMNKKLAKIVSRMEGVGEDAEEDDKE
jgi:hypothetical protein